MRWPWPSRRELDELRSRVEVLETSQSRLVTPEHYQCSKCHCLVARFEMRDGKPVCANCLADSKRREKPPEPPQKPLMRG